MGIISDINALLSIADRIKGWWISMSGRTDMSVVGRFVCVFEAHGVHRNQIPRFFGHGLTLADLQDDAALLKRLDEPLLEAVCDRFAVRREWLEGASVQIHPCHDFYKHPEEFVGFIEKRLADNPGADMRGTLITPETAKGEAQALLVLEECIGAVGDQRIYRYTCLI